MDKSILKQELIQKIISLENEKSAFKFQQGDGVDISITWDYQKAYAILGPVDERELKKDYTAFLSLDEKEKKVRIYEESSEISRPTMGGFFMGLLKLLFTGKASIGMFKGTERGFQTKAGMHKSYTLGQVFKTGSPKAVDYTFNNAGLKSQIKKIVKESGWKYKTSFSKKGVLKP